MVMISIEWCKKQDKGIKLVERSESIAGNYIKESGEDFSMIEKQNPKWKIITSYYSCYNLVYAILVKIGIKCEIHDCSISLMGLIGFEEEEIKFLKKLKEDRINAQYYLKSSEVDEGEVIEFLNKCKEIIYDMNDDKIEEIRGELDEK